MKKKTLYSTLLVAAFLTGCSTHDDIDNLDQSYAVDSRELQGVEAVIVGAQQGGATRSGTVTTLTDYVGRDVFVADDQIKFTKICRTENPISTFSYPHNTDYDGIIFQAGAEGGWSRTSDGGPERIYWTDALNNHTFIGYSIPQDYYHDAEHAVEFDWKKYAFENAGTTITYYIGSLGDYSKTGEDNDTIDYTLTEVEQTTNTATVNDVIVYANPKLECEDLLLTYNTEKVAETGGSVALIDFYHGLSSVRVVVNISGFSSSSTAADNAAVVSNMRLLNQPTLYYWTQSNHGAQELRAFAGDAQAIVNTAYGTTNNPLYNQTKSLRLWIPQPLGVGENQSKTFTFYGITTPQDAASTDSITLKFDVTYPNPMKPSTNQTKTYTAKLGGVDFWANYNTTINISLNHRNEQMTVGAQYENWQFVATPDVGELKKNSTFLQNTDFSKVTIHTDDAATIDDATWLYKATVGGSEIIYDIYGNTGDEGHPYKICTAYQLLSFAKEVENGYDFSGKFIRLDADITMQTSPKKTYEEMAKLETEPEELAKYDHALDWIGIGNDTHPFNGTFRGGERYIYRLNGKPLFNKIGENGRLRHVQMTVINIDGSGAIAETNAGLICGSSIMGNVGLSGTTGGALVGVNTGNIFCSYHIGDTESTTTSGEIHLGGLAGTNSGEIANSYQAGRIEYAPNVTSEGSIKSEAIAYSNSGTLYNCYYNSSMLTPKTASVVQVTGKTSAEMTKTEFVTLMNEAIDSWHTTHQEFDWHQYQHNPANYPTLSPTLKTN